MFIVILLSIAGFKAGNYGHPQVPLLVIEGGAI
jgi:hypothetical protein